MKDKGHLHLELVLAIFKEQTLGKSMQLLMPPTGSQSAYISVADKGKD